MDRVEDDQLIDLDRVSGPFVIKHRVLHYACDLVWLSLEKAKYGSISYAATRAKLAITKVLSPSQMAIRS